MPEYKDPKDALEDLREESLLPHPVVVRDMLMRTKLPQDVLVELNREFQDYLKHYGQTENTARKILERLVQHS